MLISGKNLGGDLGVVLYSNTENNNLTLPKGGKTTEQLFPFFGEGFL